jgi:hypothetical protein
MTACVVLPLRNSALNAHGSANESAILTADCTFQGECFPGRHEHKLNFRFRWTLRAIPPVIGAVHGWKVTEERTTTPQSGFMQIITLHGGRTGARSGLRHMCVISARTAMFSFPWRLLITFHLRSLGRSIARGTVMCTLCTVCNVQSMGMELRPVYSRERRLDWAPDQEPHSFVTRGAHRIARLHTRLRTTVEPMV